MDITRDEALQRAIDIAGGQAALARVLGVTQPAVFQWRRLPPERVLAVEAATGISRYELRPDIYGPESPK